jgi:microcystin-dependent protein
MMKVRSRIFAALATIGLLYLNAGSVAMAGTLLPPGEQTFFDNNGLPLSAGCVFFYVPGTTTPKATYQNSGQTVTNTNPVQLDAAGRAIIYGTGTYRQIVTSTGANPSSPCSPAGTQIWDQLTASTDSSATIFAGASAGTPNAITVVAPAFSGTDGQVINYISTNTNTGPATFNPSGFGAVQIVRDSSIGPQALTGGEIVATNAVSLIYDATAGTFHILSPVTWPATGAVPVGTMIASAGFTAPSGYAFAYGQAVSRTTYSSLLSALTSAQSGSITNGSPTVTGLSDTSQFARGKSVEATGIPAGTTIQSCTSSTCTLSANATSTRTGTITVFPYGNGDGSTTFNLPDMRGRTPFGRDNIGGTAANNSQIATTLTTTSASATATVGSAAGLALGMSLNGNSNVAPGTTISAISGTTLTLSANATGTQSNVPTRFSVFPDAQGLGVAGGSPTSSLVTVNSPPYTPSGSVSTGSIGIQVTFGSFTAGANNAVTSLVNSGGATLYTLTNFSGFGFTGNANGGASIPFSNIPNSVVINWAVRLTP